MRKQQLIQLLQFIAIWVIVWLFVVFVMEESFIDFILKYWLYLLIVSFSYFYYYSIQYETDKKYVLIRNILIYGNAYLFFHIFFRPQLNISHQLFVLLWLIILGIWWTTKLKTRWKYLLQILWWIFSFFILISGMFYFYPDEPDINGFLQNRTTQLSVFGIDSQIDKRDAYIKITNIRENKDLIIMPNINYELSENQIISYPSTKSQRDEKFIIQTPQWDVFWIFPQSEIQLEFSWDNLKTVSKLNWKVWFLSWMFDSSIEYLWETDNLTKEQQEWIEWIKNEYIFELVSYLKSQISISNISRANNTIMYNIDGKIIKYLAKMFPVTFSKNLDNYNEFQKYFSLIDDWIDLGRYAQKQWSWESIQSIWWNMEDNINIWKDNTYWRFKKPQKK